MNKPDSRTGALASPGLGFRVAFSVGMAVFFIAITIASILYPGGNRFDAQFEGYSFTGNFLCDLFHRTGYNGEFNSGRFYAVLGTYTLALTLLLYWLTLPKLFESLPRHARAVKGFGGTAMAISLFIATPLHDWCINIGVPLGVIAFIVSIMALRKVGERKLAGLGIVSVALCVVNYLSLIFRVFPGSLPGLQKITLLVFLSWVIAGGIRLEKMARPVRSAE
jgi:hypothetical protein